MVEVFVGESDSFGGKTTVEVTVENDRIIQIDITDINDTKAVSANAERKIPQRIIEAQSTEVEGQFATVVYLKEELEKIAV